MSKKTGGYRRRLKVKLYDLQGGLCCWCFCKMIHPADHFHVVGAVIPSNTCTYEHLYDRGHPERGKHSYVNLVSCHGCNSSRKKTTKKTVRWLRKQWPKLMLRRNKKPNNPKKFKNWPVSQNEGEGHD